MKKHLLLSTILASSALLPFNAGAIISIEYTPNHTFRVDGVEYNNFNLLKNAIEPRVKTGEDIAEPSTDSFVRLFEDLLDKPAFRQDLYNFFASLDLDEDDEDAPTFEEINAGLDLVKNLLVQSGLTVSDIVRIAEELDLEDLNLEDLPKYFATLQTPGTSPATGLLSAAQAKTLETQVINANEKLVALKAEVTALESQVASAESKATLKAKNDELYSSAELNNFVRSPENQEALKLIVQAIQNAQSNNLTESAKDKLDRLALTISKYAPNVDNATSLTPIQTPDTKTTDSMQTSVQNIANVIGGRLTGFAGVAAGDYIEHYGFWAKGTFSTGTQKSKGLSDGYKYNLMAITLGADIGEENMVGGAYSYINNTVKSKLNSANKDEIPLHLISLYGMANLDNVFVNGQVHYGFGKLKKKRATGDAQGNVVRGKPKAHTMGGSINAGYDFAVSAMEGGHIVPSVGISYIKNTVKGYSETGTGLTRTVGKRNTDRTAGLLGLMYKHDMQSGNMNLVPEIHANIDYAFNNKSSATKVTIVSGLDPIVVAAEKPIKALYTLGGSLKMLNSKAFEASAGYDYGFGKKFNSHTGTVKVRVNF